MMAVKEMGSLATQKQFQGWWHYWLVVNLPEAISRKLMLPKQAGCMAAFLAREGMENTLIRWMQKIFSQQQQVELTLELLRPDDQQPARWQVQNPAVFEQLRQQLYALNPYLQGSDCPAIQFGSFIQWRLPTNGHAGIMPFQTAHIQFSLQEFILYRKPYHAGDATQVQVFGLKPNKLS
ncbi:MAG: hypothetical protein EBX50_11125 [Chitinophagia bacterium]|nr:hypothetical protein [Chitinophagia bacterium]